MTTRRRRQAMSLCITFLLGGGLAGAAPGHADVESAAASPVRATSLVGSWRVVVNRGTPAEFHALMIFHRDGTLTTSDSNAAVGPGAGVWRSVPGVGRRAAAFELFWDSNDDGAFDLRLRVHLPIRLLNDDTWIAGAVTDVLALDGTFLFRVPQVFPNEATRMQL